MSINDELEKYQLKQVEDDKSSVKEESRCITKASLSIKHHFTWSASVFGWSVMPKFIIRERKCIMYELECTICGKKCILFVKEHHSENGEHHSDHQAHHLKG